MTVFSPFFFTSAESTATTMACEERSEHHHSGGGGLLRPGSSYCPQRSHKSHIRTLVTGLQRAGGGGCRPGWCHKVKGLKCDVSVYTTSSGVDMYLLYMCISNQADRIWAFHGWLASGERDEATSVPSRVGGWVFQVPTVSWIQNVRSHLFCLLRHTLAQF